MREFRGRNVSNNTNLYLITNDYPYGNGETSFIEPELPYLKEKFSVTIISTSLSKEQTEIVDQDINVVHYTREASIFRKIIDSLCYFISKDAYCELVDIIRGEKKLILGRIVQSILFFEEARRFKRFLKNNKVIDDNSKGIVYCYWYTFYCYTVTKLYGTQHSNLNVITRTHRYDLYDDANQYRRQPFKRQMDSLLRAVVFIAEHGRRYYLERYGFYPNEGKYVLYRLGVEGSSKYIEKAKEGSHFLVVSCAMLIPRKRVELIIEGLSEITEMNIEWIHFGDGPERIKLKTYADKMLGEKKNIKYSFRKGCSAAQIVNFYKENYIDMFITTTKSEGCPVSVQEAMSCGIPIVGTRVAEIPYMIRENGVLLSEDPDAAEIATAIRSVYYAAPENIKRMRKTSYELWMKEFNMKQNATKFVNFLLKCEEDN